MLVEVDGDRLTFSIEGDRTVPTADEAYAILVEGQTTFRGLPVEILTLPQDIQYSRYPAELRVEIKYSPSSTDSGLRCMCFVTFDGESLPLNALRERTSDHIVANGTWYPFAPGALSSILEVFDKHGIHNVGSITLRQYLALKRDADQSPWLVDRTDEQVIHPGLHIEMPQGALALFKGDLYPYQRQGWQWLAFICREGLGAILADEMGLGKTIQVIALFASPDRETVAPSLIVAPTSILENWRREIAKFAPSLKVEIHQGPLRTGLPDELRQNDVVITSYDTAVRDGGLLRMIDWQLLVVDEAQAIKNAGTRRAAAIKRLPRRVGIAVTGTPIENRLTDLWSITDFVLPGHLGKLAEFEGSFVDDVEGATRLEPLVSPLMLRRRVSEVAQDLPPRIDIPQILSLTDDESQLYEQIRRATVAEYGQAATLVSLIRLRMFCAHPMLLNVGGPDLTAFTKFARLAEIMDEIVSNGEKALIFTSYNRMSDLIVDYFSKALGIFASSINGRTPVPDRQPTIDRFTAEIGPGVLALNPRAAGAGLNITAATHVIHYNLEWNPAVEDQASARAHRRGQERPVTVHRLYMAETVEEVVNARLDRKRQLSEAAVVGVDGRDADTIDLLRALQISPVRSQ